MENTGEHLTGYLAGLTDDAILVSFAANGELNIRIIQPVEVKIVGIDTVKIQIRDQALWGAMILGLSSFAIAFLYSYLIHEGLFSGPLFAYMVGVWYSWHFILAGFILGFLRIKYKIRGDLRRYQVLRPKLRRYIVPGMGISPVSE